MDGWMDGWDPGIQYVEIVDRGWMTMPRTAGLEIFRDHVHSVAKVQVQ